MDLRDYIQEYTLDIPDTFIQDVLKEYKDDIKLAKILGGEATHIRNCKEINLSLNRVNDNRKMIDKLLFTEINKAFLLYVSDKKITTTNDTGYNFLIYEEGGFYKEHVDDYAKEYFRRRVSAVLFLNDDFEGGELVFFNKSHVITPKKNKIVFFPSLYMFPHQVLPITKGIRYSIVTWFI